METDYKPIDLNENVFAEYFDEDMCRACLTDKSLLPLFIEQEGCFDAGNGILNMFILCSGLEASWKDEFPKHICHNCLEELYRFYEFWKKCRNSVDVLSKVITSLMCEQDAFNNDTVVDNLSIKPDNTLETTPVEFEDYTVEEVYLETDSDDSGQDDSKNPCTDDEISYEDILVHTKNSNENIDTKRLIQPVQCYKCKIKFYYNDEYIKHDCKPSAEKTFPCEHCGEKFPTFDKRRKHILRLHRDFRPFACKLCPKTFQFALGLIAHKRTHTSEEPFRCTICNMHFKTTRILHSHRLEHGVDHKHTCPLCDEGFSKYTRLQNHLKDHPEISDIISKQHLCQECGRTFKSNGYLQEHIRTIHFAIDEFPCDLCDKKFKSKGYLAVHMRIHVPEKKYECQHCQEKFRTWNLRSVHIRTHHSDEKPFVCKICSKGFKFSGRLTIHLRQHSGEKPYACNECPMAFVSSSRLKAHMVVHTGEKKFSCPICQKRFSRRQFVKTHMNVHINERKFKCNLCNNAYKHASMLKLHMKTHEEEGDTWSSGLET